MLQWLLRSSTALQFAERGLNLTKRERRYKHAILCQWVGGSKRCLWPFTEFGSCSGQFVRKQMQMTVTYCGCWDPLHIEIPYLQVSIAMLFDKALPFVGFIHPFLVRRCIGAVSNSDTHFHYKAILELQQWVTNEQNTKFVLHLLQMHSALHKFAIFVFVVAIHSMDSGLQFFSQSGRIADWLVE